MDSHSFVVIAIPYVVLGVQGALMMIDEGLYHRWRVLGRGESWSHIVDTLLFVTTLSITAFLPPTTGWIAAFAALSVLSSLLITKDEWIHAKECSAGEHWIHSLLFVVHPMVLISMGYLWLRQENPSLRIIGVVSALVMLFQQWLYWIGMGHASRRAAPTANNAVYESLGNLWFEGEHHAQALLRKENVVRLDYIRAILSKENVPQLARVLDVGCGAGLLATPLSAAGFQVKALDRSADALAAARARAVNSSNPTYMIGDARDLREPDGSYDVVLLLGIFEQVEEPQRVLQEAARALKPGGLLVFQTFNRTWLAWLTAVHGMKLIVSDVPRNIRVHRLFVKPSELEAMATREGLLARDMRGIRPRLVHKSCLLSVVNNRLHPEFSFVLSRSKALGYLGYFIKAAPRTAELVA